MCVGFLLDTFHMNIEEKNIPDAIRRAGKHIFEFHADSNDRGTPGEDHLTWSEIAAALREVAYEGPVVIEAFTPHSWRNKGCGICGRFSADEDLTQGGTRPEAPQPHRHTMEAAF